MASIRLGVEDDQGLAGQGPARIVNDRPSRLFSAQQETVQRSPGWETGSSLLCWLKCGCRDAACC